MLPYAEMRPVAFQSMLPHGYLLVQGSQSIDDGSIRQLPRLAAAAIDDFGDVPPCLFPACTERLHDEGHGIFRHPPAAVHPTFVSFVLSPKQA